MRKFGLAAFATAAVLWAAPASAVSIGVDWIINSDALNDPGLVVGFSDMSGTLNFNLDQVGDTYTKTISYIGTNEHSIEGDDLANKALSVSVDMFNPQNASGVANGYTTAVGYGIFGVGVVNFLSPATLSVGGLSLLVTFSDAVFALNNPLSDFFFDRKAPITATFKLTGLPSVPVPPALALFGSGLVGMALLARRRKPKKGALQGLTEQAG